MKLIALTCSEQLVFINPDKIVYFRPLSKGSRIVFGEFHESYFSLEVNETPDQVIEAIGLAEAK